MKKLSLLTLIITLFFSVSKAQLFVDTAYSVPQMMEDFFDTTGATISNITYTGVNAASGFFDYDSTDLGVNAGILITSGSVFNALQPNEASNISTANNADGDADLNSLIPGFNTYDASVIQFDIVPPSDTMFFKYVFASEEYNEYVGSSFNDVFAFFLTGPGYADSNVAAIPGTTIPVSINNVNCGNYGSYYVCNDPWTPASGGCTNECPTTNTGATIEYDGMTKAMPIHAIVESGETYHVKIAIADAGDGIFDSGVFLSIESLGGQDSLAVTGQHSKEENGNTVHFTDHSKYASHWFWDFGDGTFSAERNPVHTYNDLGTTGYMVKERVWNFCCTDSVYSGVGNYMAVENLLNNPLTVAPNPVSSMLNIHLTNASKGNLFLYDITGRVLISSAISGDKQLDMSAFPSGNYLLAFVDEKGIHRQKILKQ